MSIVFELTRSEAIRDVEEFCRIKKDELTYIGEFADKETSKVIRGSIVQYDNKFYTTEAPRASGVCSYPADEEGMVTTIVSLLETNEYDPEKCKPLTDCPIRIDIWNIHVDDEGAIVGYAFYEDQLEEARKVVNQNKDIDIFFKGQKVSREYFLNDDWQ